MKMKNLADIEIRTGDNVSPELPMEHAVEIGGIASGSGLKFSFNFNEYEYDRENIEKLALCFKANLLKIIEHCSRQKKEHSAPGMTAREYQIKKDYDAYLQRVQQEKLPDFTIKNYRHILLTGATGYLGAHLIPVLLKNTDAVIYLPVRGSTAAEAETRLRHKLSFYFGKDFPGPQTHRLEILKGDLREDKLGMDPAQYEPLVEIVDLVVHPAANVKHYGLYEELYKDNVKGTQQLLELALTGKNKDFYHISTPDVGRGRVPGKDYTFFTEYCHDLGQTSDNIYFRTKFEAEKKVLSYRTKGLNASIIRVGNLVSHSETGKFQENIEDDYFYSIVKGIISAGILTDTMEKKQYDMSFINYAAEAVALLITRDPRPNETYHVCNPNFLNMKDMKVFLKETGIELRKVKENQLQDYLSELEGKRNPAQSIERAKLHAGILEERVETPMITKEDRTVRTLRALGFEWPKVNKIHIKKMIEYCKEVGFL